MKKVLRFIRDGSIPEEVLSRWYHYNNKEPIDYKALLSYRLVSRTSFVTGLILFALIIPLLYADLYGGKVMLPIFLLVVFGMLMFSMSVFFEFTASRKDWEILGLFTKDLQFFVGLARYIQINMGEYSIETILKEDVQKRILRLGARELNTIEKLDIGEYLSILQYGFLSKIINYRSDNDDLESLAARVLRITMIFGLKLP